MKAMRRMSRTSRTVTWRMRVQASASIARPPFARVAALFRPVGQDGLGRADRPGDRPDVVDPEDVGAALDREDRRGDRPLEPPRGRQVEDRAEERLPRDADKDRPAEALESLLAAQELEVVLERLAETD